MPSKPKNPDAIAVETATRVAREIIGLNRWADSYEDALVAHALAQYEKIEDKQTIRNLGGLFATVIRRKVIDIKRQLKVSDRRLQELGALWADAPNLTRGLSDVVIRREAAALLALQFRAAMACITDSEARAMIEYKVYSKAEPNLREIGERFGGLGAAAVHNRLGRYFGLGDRPGGLEPVLGIFEDLSLPTAKAFVEILETYESRDMHDDPIAAAISYLQEAGKSSPGQRDLVSQAQGRLRWLANHLPNNRGLVNQVLRRLIFAGCFYVLEADDAKSDRHHPRGLRDDVEILDRIWGVTRNHV